MMRKNTILTKVVNNKTTLRSIILMLKKLKFQQQKKTQFNKIRLRKTKSQLKQLMVLQAKKQLTIWLINVLKMLPIQQKILF